MIKVTRDAELDMEGDVSKSYINKIIESVRDRFLAEPVRLVYDKEIAPDTLEVIKNLLELVRMMLNSWRSISSSP